MSKLGLGIGRTKAQIGGITQEILTWYDEHGDRYLSGEEQERKRAERLEAYLRSQGIDPEQLPE